MIEHPRWHPETSVWAFRVGWVVLAVVAGTPVSDALTTHSAAVRAVVTVGAAAIGATVLIGAAVPHPLTLTAVRGLAPLGVALTGWAASSEPSVTAMVAVALATLCTAAAFTTGFSDVFVNASAYGDERRFALRAPAPLLLGPLVVVWLIGATGLVAGPLLLAARQWIVGGLGTVLGLALAAWAARSLHLLAQRFVVFVPAGMTLVDPITLVDSVLFARREIISIGPALVGTDARDLTAGSAGLAVEIAVAPPAELTVRTARTTGEVAVADAILFTPSRPKAVLSEAERRGVSG